MRAWWKKFMENNIIAADPFPSYGYMDWLDGLKEES